MQLITQRTLLQASSNLIVSKMEDLLLENFEIETVLGGKDEDRQPSVWKISRILSKFCSDILFPYAKCSRYIEQFSYMSGTRFFLHVYDL